MQRNYALELERKLQTWGDLSKVELKVRKCHNKQMQFRAECVGFGDVNLFIMHKSKHKEFYIAVEACRETLRLLRAVEVVADVLATPVAIKATSGYIDSRTDAQRISRAQITSTTTTNAQPLVTAPAFVILNDEEMRKAGYTVTHKDGRTALFQWYVDDWEGLIVKLPNGLPQRWYPGDVTITPPVATVPAPQPAPMLMLAATCPVTPIRSDTEIWCDIYEVKPKPRFESNPSNVKDTLWGWEARAGVGKVLAAAAARKEAQNAQVGI